MKVQKFTIKGAKTEDMTLPKEFSVNVNLPLLAQAVYVYEKRSHIGLRKTKTRSEVNRTTKKVYKQKGTGGARHGSRRAPIFVGGGVAFGPRPIKRVLTLPTNIKNKAKFMALSLKSKDNKVVCVSGLSKVTKTAEAGKLVKSLGKELLAKKFTFILSEKAKEAPKFLRNLKNVSFIFYKDINALDIYKGGMIVIDEEIFAGEKVSKVAKTSQVSKVKKEAKKGTK